MITLSQPTRAATRATVKALRSNGKLVEVIDKGRMFKGSDRWGVLVFNAVVTSKKQVKKTVKVRKNKNVGFDIRNTDNGVKYYDLFFDGVFVLRRDTKLECYEQAVKIANIQRIDYSDLSYK